MKIEIKKTEKEKKSYPWVGYYRDVPDIIVLFTSPFSGVCLNHSSKSNIGKYSNMWLEHTYLLFDGQIIIKNS